jgi:hypothetical protein
MLKISNVLKTPCETNKFATPWFRHHKVKKVTNGKLKLFALAIKTVTNEKLKLFALAIMLTL